MKLDQVRCNSIYRIVSRQSWLHIDTFEQFMAPFSRHPRNSDAGLLQVDVLMHALQEFDESLLAKLVDEFGVCCRQRNRVVSDPQFYWYIPHQGAVCCLR
jgi:hypothetical protein